MARNDTVKAEHQCPDSLTSSMSLADTQGHDKVRRTEPRVVLRLPITLEGTDPCGNDFVEKTSTENVSRRGACAELPRAIEAGAVLRLTSLERQLHTRVQAVVTWCSSFGPNRFRVGLHFLEAPSQWVVT
ncbi:MAG: PilZ domain-containing protein [Acidobacteriia bacterium]|nr:PilZ domain-containing protein [Terriglobia bacterium]